MLQETKTSQTVTLPGNTAGLAWAGQPRRRAHAAVQALAKAHPNLIFWAGFWLLNLLLFLPTYLLESENATLLPGLAGDGWANVEQLLIWRTCPCRRRNHD